MPLWTVRSHGQSLTRRDVIDIKIISFLRSTDEKSKQTNKQKQNKAYRQVSNIRHTLVGNKMVDHSDVVGASPVGAARTTSSFST